MMIVPGKSLGRTLRHSHFHRIERGRTRKQIENREKEIAILFLPELVVKELPDDIGDNSRNKSQAPIPVWAY